MSVEGTLLAGRYRLVAVIAAGGMGVVWEAWDELLERSVAVKQLRTLPGLPDAETELAKDRAMREARITARLHHPHAVPVFDAVEDDGTPCLVMQLLPSTPLSAVLRDSGPLPLGQVVAIGSQVASALAAAHHLGIVHRDVKPGNILITADGSAHISDFGISHAMGDATLTRTGMIHGTPAYLAPEMARGEEASFPADVFSLGSTLYAAVEGSPPFGSEGNSIALLHKVAAGRVPPPTRAGSLIPLLLDMLSSQPGSRPTMESVALSLAELGTHLQTTTPYPVPVPAAAPPGVPPSNHPGSVDATAVLEPHDAQDRLAPTAGRTQEEGESALSWWFPEDRTSTGSAGAPTTVEHTASLADGAERGTPPETEVHADGEAPNDAPGDDKRSPTSAGRRRRPTSSILLVVGAIAVALVLLWPALTDRLQIDRGGVGTGAAGHTTSPTPAPTSGGGAGTRTGTPTQAQVTPQPQTPTQPFRTAQPTPTRTPSVGRASADQATLLSTAITDYYSLLPDKTAEAWPRMTAAYQTQHAGAMDAYQEFWQKISDIGVSNVTATPPDRVVATLTYRYKNGKVIIERTSFRLVDDGRLLKIAQTEVISSRRG